MKIQNPVWLSISMLAYYSVCQRRDHSNETPGLWILHNKNNLVNSMAPLIF